MVRTHFLMLDAATVPATVTNVIALPGDSQAALWFNASSIENGGAALTGFRVQLFINGSSQPASPAQSFSLQLPLVVKQLVNGWQFQFAVAAVNAQGVGLYSALSNAVMPFAVPSNSSFNYTIAPAGSVATAIRVTMRLTADSATVASWQADQPSFIAQLTRDLANACGISTDRIVVEQTSWLSATSVQIVFVILPSDAGDLPAPIDEVSAVQAYAALETQFGQPGSALLTGQVTQFLDTTVPLLSQNLQGEGELLSMRAFHLVCTQSRSAQTALGRTAARKITLWLAYAP